MSSFEIEVNVYRNLPKEILLDRDTAYKVNILNYKQKISSHDLVPGDLIEIPEDNLMPADIILLNGKIKLVHSLFGKFLFSKTVYIKIKNRKTTS